MSTATAPAGNNAGTWIESILATCASIDPRLPAAIPSNNPTLVGVSFCIRKFTCYKQLFLLKNSLSNLCQVLAKKTKRHVVEVTIEPQRHEETGMCMSPL
jgi:hypothetical protein